MLDDFTPKPRSQGPRLHACGVDAKAEELQGSVGGTRREGSEGSGFGGRAKALLPTKFLWGGRREVAQAAAGSYGQVSWGVCKPSGLYSGATH